MFTDLAFLQVPTPASGESAGLAPVVSQPLENSEFSILFPVVQAVLLERPEAELPELPAGQQVLAELLASGQVLPLTGATLPQPGLALPGQPGLPQVETQPAPVIPTPPHGVPRTNGPLVELPSPDPAPGAPDRPAGVPGPELLLERQLSPQLTSALTNARAVESAAVAHNPIESLVDDGDLGLDSLPLRVPSGGRPPPARDVSMPTINLQVDKPSWQPALGERLVWMVSHAQQRAEIKLDPPQLGRLEVHVVMQGDRVQLAFAAETQASRELLEQSLPRLREMMADAGIDLADVNIADRERQAAQQDSADTTESSSSVQPEPAAADEVDHADGVAHGRGLLDLYV